MTHYYVTMTWHDWPEGGSYGTVVEATSFDEAEHLTRLQMAQHYVDEDLDFTPDRILAEFDHHWHLVDCIKLEEFHNHKLIKEAVLRIRDLCAAYDVTICDTAGTVITNETDTILELLR